MSYTFVWKQVWAPAIVPAAEKGEAMANQEQLEILKQGVEVWNEWRKDNPDVEIDLVGAYLKGLYLSKAMLARAVLFEANLTEADLSFVNLAGATLARADLIRANLSGADID